MTGHLTVLLDACVLYPAPLRDLLMRLALQDLFQARWTTQIHEEWIRNVLAKNERLQRDKLERTAQLMSQAIPDSLVTGYESLIGSLQLPDKHDRHVLAAAIKGQAELIVTFNLKDFPTSHLEAFNIWAIHPDEFISDLIETAPERVILAARQQRAALRKPPQTTQDYIDAILRQRLPRTANFLSKQEALI